MDTAEQRRQRRLQRRREQYREHKDSETPDERERSLSRRRQGMQLVDNRVSSDLKFKYSGRVLSYSIIICIVCHTVKPDFVASVERERLQARCREATPERWRGDKRGS